jgi:hypothetical protein
MHLRHPTSKPIAAWNTWCDVDKSYTLAFREEWEKERQHGVDRESNFFPPRAEQLSRLSKIKELVAKIGRPMPDALPTDYDRGAIGKPTY